MKKRIILSLSTLFLNFQILCAAKIKSYYFEESGKTFIRISGINSYSDKEISAKSESEKNEKNKNRSLKEISQMLSNLKEKKKKKDSAEYHFYLEDSKKKERRAAAFRFGIPSLAYCFDLPSEQKKHYKEVSLSRLKSYVKKRLQNAWRR